MSSALPSVLAASSCSASFLFCPFNTVCSTDVSLFIRSSSSASFSASLFRPLGDDSDVAAAAAEPLFVLSASSSESSLLRFKLALTPSSKAFAFWALMSARFSSIVVPDPLLAVCGFEFAAASGSTGSIAIARFVMPSNLLSAARSNRSFDLASCRSSCSKRCRHPNE